MIWLLAACASKQQSTPKGVQGCEPGTPEIAATGFVNGTEGITFTPDGRLFVAAGDAVVELSDDGNVLTSWSVRESLGLAWWEDEDVLVAAGSEGVLLLEEGEDPVVLVDTDAIEVPNFITPTSWGTLLVSDDFDTWIYEVTPKGESTQWLQIPSPNGMVFVGDDLWVATTFAEPAPIWRVAVDDGVPAAPVVVVDYEAGTTPDGLAADDAGGVYVALNLAGRIEVIRDGEASHVGAVPWVASLAFEPGTCDLWATSLFSADVWKLPGG